MKIYVGRWDLVYGGILEVEDFTEEEARAEMERERGESGDKRIDAYTLKELESEINNDIDVHEPFSLKYWVRIFED